ncbi:MAG: hypothetical protein CL843_19290 [Crocinitomicaceae bacterium]|nr:hypothetical protein [Crocinitomicaceae bacterium]
MNTLKTIISAVMLTTWFSITIAQNPGDIDISFNLSDIGFLDEWGANDYVYDSELLSDSNFIIVGRFISYNNESINRIAKINSDGTLNTSFDPGTAIGTTSAYAIYSVAIQSDNKIIIGGYFDEYNGTTANNFARINENGSIDATFATSVGTGFNGEVQVVELQTNGKILVGGDFTDYNGTPVNNVVRLNTDGTIDNTFNVNTDAPVYAFAFETSGKIVVGGDFTTLNNSTYNRIARVDSSGAIDNTFNPGTGADAEIYDIEIQSDGKIVAVGDFEDFDTATVNRIVRLQTDGSIDNGFDPGIGAPGTQTLRDIYVLANGQYLVCGKLSSFNGISNYSIVRLNSNGNVDTTFTGKLSSYGRYGYSILVQPDGKILVGGEFYTYDSNEFSAKRFARLNTDGSYDFSFNPATGLNSTVSDIAIQPDRKIILGGDFTTYNNERAHKIIRLNEDGSRDTTFQPLGNSFINKTTDYILSLAIQPDGKILVGGQFETFENDTVNGIVRLNSDGSRDTTFNTGIGLTDQNGNGDNLSDIEVLPNGKILIAGDFYNYNNTPVYRITRLNADGSLDTSFDQGGFGTGASVAAIDVDSNGYIYTGLSGNGIQYNGTSLNGRMARLTPDGAFDPTFAAGATGGFGGISAVKCLPDSTVVSGGVYISSYSGYTTRGPFHFFYDGTLDTTFTGTSNAAGGSGITYFRTIMDILVQADGKIIAGGNFTTYNGDIANYLVRLNPDGSIDNSFSSGIGLAGEQASTSGATTITKIVEYPDNRAMIAGSFTSYNETGRNYVTRIHLNTCDIDTGTATHYVCENSFTWIDGNTYTTDNHTAMFTIAGGASGCDSTVILDLTFVQPSASNDVQEVCGNEYTWIDGNTYTTNNNTATYTLTNASGCDSVVTLNLTLNPLPTPTITQNGNTLTTDAYSAYQWYFNGTAITGATNQTYTATQDGEYTVSVTDNNGCSDSSDAFNVTNTGINNLSETNIHLYPNPTSGKLTITAPPTEQGSVTVYNVMGSEVFSLKTASLNNLGIDLSGQPQGVYLVKIMNKNTAWTTSIVVE